MKLVIRCLRETVVAFVACGGSEIARMQIQWLEMWQIFECPGFVVGGTKIGCDARTLQREDKEK